MPAAKLSASQLEAFNAANDLRYEDQAIFFLNAFWAKLHKQEADVYDAYELFVRLDSDAKEDGTGLPTVEAHAVFTRNGGSITNLELKALMREVDINMNDNLSLLEYLLHVYKNKSGVTVENLLRARQTDNHKLYDAQDELKAVEEAEADRLAKHQELLGKSKLASNTLVKNAQLRMEWEKEERADHRSKFEMEKRRLENRIEKASQCKLGLTPAQEFWLGEKTKRSLIVGNQH